jgi:ATP-dependent DNA helicase RecG
MLTMNLRDLNALIADGESDRVEFKRSTGQRSDAAKTVCAMLNGLGGFVLFGVTEKGEAIGQQLSAHTLEEIANELRRIEPPVFPDIETVAVGSDRAVIVLRVPGGGGPYTYDGRPYLRLGPTTSVMPRQRYERVLLERMHASHRWENQPAEGIRIGDLDHAEIARTIEEAIRRQRMDDPGTRDPTELLLGLGLIYEGQLLHAAVVLFGQSERLLPSFPQCLLRMARFRGRDKTEFVDNRQEVGNAFELLQRAQRFLRDHLPVAGRVVPHLFERVDDPLYPPPALREALANALCHRDYSVVGGSISIAIYDDRLEISSTGVLPFDLTPADLTRPHPSRPWNPLIAQVFYRRGIIEAWGRGTIKMAELTEQAGLAPPEFECATGEVLVRFRPTRYVPPTRVGHDLAPLQRELLDVLARIGPASLKELKDGLVSETPDRTVQDNLQMLRRLGLVDGIGKGRGARWMLKGVRS